MNWMTLPRLSVRSRRGFVKDWMSMPNAAVRPIEQDQPISHDADVAVSRHRAALIITHDHREPHPELPRRCSLGGGS